MVRGRAIEFWPVKCGQKEYWPRPGLAVNLLWDPSLLSSLLFSHQSTEHPDGYSGLRDGGIIKWERILSNGEERKPCSQRTLA